MKEFIYALEDLFLSDELLDSLQAEKYYIGAYQRGYKWKSFGANDQVPLFLTDIYNAYQENAPEYYLQYITIKKNDEQKSWLEIIDGQQRLTTISLLFYSFAKEFGFENITEDKVTYERYLGRAIFDEVLDFCDKDESIALLLKKHQDLYYIYHAKECIKRFLELLQDEAKSFYEYCRQKVKIIINLEDEMTSAEEIFSNLNDNKVDLTNYYLIKGLLFTKSTRPENHKTSFIEIQEQRNRISRNWDDIDNWLLDTAQNQLFFNAFPIINTKEENIGINSLLNALRPIEIVENSKETVVKEFRQSLNNLSVKNVVDDYLLFNSYNEHLTNQSKAEAKLIDVYQTSKRLRNWYSDIELYNLIGFYTSTRGNVNEILQLGNTEVKKKLYLHLKSRLDLGEVKISQLNYSDPKKRRKLNTILLALNIFTLKKIESKVCIDFSNSFDFKSYREHHWSIEHIYPQNPDCSETDYEEYYEWFSNLKFKDINNPIAIKIKLKEALSKEELQLVAQQDIDEHQLGNLALLTSGNNSTLQNYIFPKKRKLLLNLISSGSFVPQHTINAVSKLLNNADDQDSAISFTTNLTEWNQQDIDSNALWIINAYEQLLKIVNQVTVKN